MRIAIPVHEGSTLAHFGAARAFMLYDVDNESRAVAPLGLRLVPDENANLGCHGLPPALRAWDVDLVLAREIGRSAINDLLLHGILAVTDTPLEQPEQLIQKLVNGQLLANHPTCVAAGQDDGRGGGSACDHCTHGH